jgi:hypothetical protein
MERSLGLMEETLAHEREALGGPTFHLQAQRLAKVPKRHPREGDIMHLLGFLMCKIFKIKFEFNIVKGKSKGC